MTKQIRRITQIVFFAAFLYIIFAGTSPSRPLEDPLIKMDPLVVGSALIALRKFVPKFLAALIVLIPTLFLGRVFCGWICPLGTTLDLSDKIFYRQRKHRDAAGHPQLKYYVLAGLFVTALFSMQAVYFFDPICIMTRSIALVFFAPIQLFLRSIQDLLGVWSGSSFGPLASSSLWISGKLANWSIVNGEQAYYRQAWVFLAIFVGIIGLNSFSRRFWCRNLCPLGALLALCSRIPVLKRVVSHECIECGKCTRECKMAAIPYDPHKTRSTKCIECFDCVPICPKDAEKFGLKPRPEFSPETGIDISRRRVLQGAGIGLAFAALAKLDPAAKYARNAFNVKLSSPGLIRPPGARLEHEFVNLCIRCGACIKACPTSGLQPSLNEAGIEGFWTPVLVPRIGPCLQDCTACGRVCPTGAIRKLEKSDKPNTMIGTSMVDHSQCLAWGQGKDCLVCKEYCPYVAIDAQVVRGVGCPVVNEAKCVGCGACENACPIQPVAAIRVFSRGDKRA
jgi:MauM/NapG family ferredoxin protein